MFSCTSDRKPCCGPKIALSFARECPQTIDDVNELMIDRSRVADDADPLSVEARGCEQPFGSE